jgi:hypothetical protein
MDLIDEHKEMIFKEALTKLFPDMSEFSANYYLSEMNKMWSEFKIYAYDNFQKQLENCPDKIHSYKFEMLVGLHLKKIGLNLSKTPNGEGLPDLLITLDNKAKLWIECCSPQGKTIPQRKGGEIHGFAVNPSLTNITSVLVEKGKQYEKRIKTGKIKPDDNYIIAIDGSKLEIFDQHRLFPQIYEAIFPFSESEIITGNKNYYKISPAKNLLKKAPVKTEFNFEDGIISTGKLGNTKINCGTEAEIPTDFFKIYPNILGILFFPRYTPDNPIFIQNPSINAPEELKDKFIINDDVINFLKNYDYQKEIYVPSDI